MAAHDTASEDARRALVAWFHAQRRKLPWRDERSPYRVWVSEVMLQQTRADTAAKRYEGFLETFPDVDSLAAAPHDHVLKAWEGLGYYRRARLLQDAAREIVARHGGTIPADVDHLRALPGFGPYTAAAVAALAFDRPAIPVDANVRRVGSRLFGLRSPRDRDVASRLRAWLGVGAQHGRADRGRTPGPDVEGGEPDGHGEASPSGPPAPVRVNGDVVEALIELGALVCTPRRPSCEACPVALWCVARDEGRPERYPVRRDGERVPVRTRTAIVSADEDGILLCRRPPTGLLGGMWGPPQREGDLPAPPAVAIGRVRHAYSHFRLELSVAWVDPQDVADFADRLDGEWVAWSRLPRLPLSAVDRKVLALVRDCETAPPAVRGMLPA